MVLCAAHSGHLLLWFFFHDIVHSIIDVNGKAKVRLPLQKHLFLIHKPFILRLHKYTFVFGSDLSCTPLPSAVLKSSGPRGPSNCTMGRAFTLHIADTLYSSLNIAWSASRAQSQRLEWVLSNARCGPKKREWRKEKKKTYSTLGGCYWRDVFLKLAPREEPLFLPVSCFCFLIYFFFLPFSLWRAQSTFFSGGLNYTVLYSTIAL